MGGAVKVHLQRATEQLKGEFEGILPGVQSAARHTLRARGWRAERLDEGVQAAAALAFKAFLQERANGNSEFTPATLGRYSALQVACGRRVTGGEPARDAMGTPARRAGVDVGPLDSFAGLVDKKARPDDAAAFRVDTASWLARLSDRDRLLAGEMAEGWKTAELAERFGVSAARVSQKRREFAEALGMAR